MAGSFGAVRGSGSVRQGGVSYFDLAMTEIAYGGGGEFNTFITHRFGIRFALFSSWRGKPDRQCAAWARTIHRAGKV